MKRSASSRPRSLGPQKPKMEVKEDVDTDEEALMRGAMHADDLAKLDQMEKEYDEQHAKDEHTPRAYTVVVKRAIGGRLSQFARGTAQRRTISVETKRKVRETYANERTDANDQ